MLPRRCYRIPAIPIRPERSPFSSAGARSASTAHSSPGLSVCRAREYPSEVVMPQAQLIPCTMTIDQMRKWAKQVSTYDACRCHLAMQDINAPTIRRAEPREWR